LLERRAHPGKLLVAVAAEGRSLSIELFSDSLGSYPADVWRWGAETTDPCTPVNGSEFTGASGRDTLGSTTHPAAGYLEDLYDVGGGPVRDQGSWTYIFDNHNPGSNVPLFITSKGSRDSRLNRAKPTAYVLWHSSKSPSRCAKTVIRQTIRFARTTRA